MNRFQIAVCFHAVVMHLQETPSPSSAVIFMNISLFCPCALTVPGSVPSQSLRATPFEDRILLYWKEPAEPNGVLMQYEVP